MKSSVNTLVGVVAGLATITNVCATPAWKIIEVHKTAI